MATDQNPATIIHAALSSEPIDADTAWNAVETDSTGAVVTFGGVVRNHDGGRDVTRLSYTAHPTANDTMIELAQQVASRHPGTRLWVAHRIGELAIGDSALIAAAASSHRGEAFDACRDLVETVKHGIPVWKEQFFADGETEWVGSA